MPLPVSFPVQQATHDPPIPGLFHRELPPSSEMSLLDSPDATKRQTRWDNALVGGQDSVHRILVRVEGDRPLRLVALWSLPTDDENDLAWDDGQRTQRPR